MVLSIFEFLHFRPYLLKIFGDKSLRKGLKSSAAKAMNCQTSFLSQVLHGNMILSLEQAEKLNHFLGHNPEESHFFLLLIQKERAGTKSLETYFQNQIDQILKNRQVLKKRVGKTDSVEGPDEFRYYSAWSYAAIHVALSIPDFSTTEQLAEAFQLPVAQVRAILDFLVQTGLAKAKGLRNFEIGPKHIHLSADSPQIRNHHVNWRLKAIQSLEANDKSNFHYSSVVTLSAADVDKVKELLIQNLNSANKVIQQSKEEEIYGLNFDFYDLRWKK